MKFDVIVGNPPYQTQVGPSKTEPMWDKFVTKSLTFLNDDGHMALIHPSGWRNAEGRFSHVKQALLDKQILYLEMNDENQGFSTFGAETRYDWYVVKNTLYNNTSTRVKFDDGAEQLVDLTQFTLIPNNSPDEFMALLAKPEEETVDVIYSSSAYDHRKSIINKTQSTVFKYPVVYTVNSMSEPRIMWCSVNTRGHFDIPKVIWSNGRISSIGSYIDAEGTYGLSPFAYAIADSPENLPLIKKAFDSKEFRKLMYGCSVGQLAVNYKAIKLFRKDFWKEFV